MMNFDVEEQSLLKHIKPSHNMLPLFKKEDLSKLRKNGFFRGSKPRKFAMPVILLKPATLLSTRATLRSASKSKKAPFLKELLISAALRDFVTRDEVFIGNLLRKARRLEKLTIEKSWQVTPLLRFVRRLTGRISNLYYLKEIKLDFSGCRSIESPEFRKLSKAIVRSINIESIDLNLVGCDGITAQDLKYLMSRVSRKDTLKSLSINLSNLKCLRTDESLFELKDTIGRMQNLQELKLCFDYDALIGDGGARALAGALSLLKNLKYMHLGLGCCNVTDTGLESLSEALFELKNLTEMNIEFWGCSGISDDGFSKLSKAVANMKRLKKLNMNVTNCQQVTDNSLVSLCNAMRGMPDLQSLELAMFGCVDLTNYGIGELEKLLRGLVKLQEVSLNIAGCPKIDADEVDMMKESLKLSPKLKDNVNILS